MLKNNDSFMTGEQYKQAIHKLYGYTATATIQFANALDENLRKVREQIAGKKPITKKDALLVTFMLHACDNNIEWRDWISVIGHEPTPATFTLSEVSQKAREEAKRLREQKANEAKQSREAAALDSLAAFL